VSTAGKYSNAPGSDGPGCTSQDGDLRRWMPVDVVPSVASRRPGVRVPLAPPGQRHNSKSWAPGLEAGTAAKYSNGDRTRCRTRVRTGPLPRRQGLRIPGSEHSSGAAEQEECSAFQSCAIWPAAGVQRARSAVSRLTFAAHAGGQSGLVLPAVAGIAPVLVDQMVPAPRAARRAEGLS
jgi:hypothetical protein